MDHEGILSKPKQALQPRKVTGTSEMRPWTWNKLFRGYQTKVDTIYLVLPNNDIVYVAFIGLKVR